jgi:hypothetical protein
MSSPAPAHALLPAVLASVVMLAAPALGYPGGTPGFQTDAAPFCAGCHSSRNQEMLAGLGERAVKELPANKHYAKISAGSEGYADLTAEQRQTLIEQLEALDEASTVVLAAPASVAAGETFEVTVSVTGGSGPVVGVALVDAAHRYFARPAPGAGWQVATPPVVRGADGEAQREWLDRRPEALGRNLSFVNVTGIASDASKGEWGSGSVTWTLRAPPAAGSYPLAAAYWYGTEKGSPLGYTTDPIRGKQVRGSFTGNSGRILFSEALRIEVR